MSLHFSFQEFTYSFIADSYFIDCSFAISYYFHLSGNDNYKLVLFFYQECEKFIILIPKHTRFDVKLWKHFFQ